MKYINIGTSKEMESVFKRIEHNMAKLNNDDESPNASSFFLLKLITTIHPSLLGCLEACQTVRWEKGT